MYTNLKISAHVHYYTPTVTTYEIVVVLCFCLHLWKKNIST